MKKYTQISLLLFAPIVLWAQTEEAAPVQIDLPNVEISLLNQDPASQVTAPTLAINGIDTVIDVNQTPTNHLVEIPDISIDDVLVNIEAPVIPEVVTAALASETEVLLDLPNQGTALGSVVMAEQETISVDFPDEEVRTILRNVADLFDLNLVIPDELQGRTSLKLRNITWQQVFDVVLKQLDYTYVEDRNIIEIVSVAELTTEPVDTRVFIINYAKASEIQSSITPLIDETAGGRIQVDVRSNALVVTERPSRMGKIKEIIDHLDRVTDQVMIESKFIEVSNGDLENIGIDWAYLDENAGDLLGGNGAGSGDPGFTPSLRDSITSPLTSGQVLGGLDTLNDGLTNIVASGSSGGLVAVFSSSEFAATLRALQSEERSSLISNPTIVVMNNQTAVFQVGEDFPIRQFSINDQTGQLETGEIEYRFVGVELDVTPSVNADDMISMDVHPMVSALGGTVITRAGPGGATILEDRIFKKRDARTQVTIKNGYTIALGGLTSEEEREKTSQIPLLGDIPILGKLFQNNESNLVSTNLIIFITAKTLNPDGSTYEDIIDPRVINQMGILPSDVPGYQIPAEERSKLREIRETRATSALEDELAQLQDELNTLKEVEVTDQNTTTETITREERRSDHRL